MGKGDVKTKKGKISNGTFGVRRPKKSNKIVVAKTEKK
jgi:30S ribosomal protein S31